MGCNCNKGNADKFAYVWTAPTGGASKTYAKEIEAQARKIRDGGTVTKTPK